MLALSALALHSFVDIQRLVLNEGKYILFLTLLSETNNRRSNSSTRCLVDPISIQSGGNQDKNVVADDDYERAEKAILLSIEKIENFVGKAVANEVDILFHKEHPHKEQVVSKTKKAVSEAVGKVKRSVEDHPERNVYPFEKNSDVAMERHGDVHKDHRILRAVEAAEQAVIHAIANEVDTLFHETEHHPKLKDSIKKASTVVEKVHDHRRDWLQNVASSMIEEYSIPDFFLE